MKVSGSVFSRLWGLQTSPRGDVEPAVLPGRLSPQVRRPVAGGPFIFQHKEQLCLMKRENVILQMV